MWYNGRRPDHIDTVNIISDILHQDKSSITVRHTYSSLKTFIRPLLESSSGELILPLLKDIVGMNALFRKYWLVKSEVCRLVGQLPFLTIQYLTKSTSLQEDALTNVLIRFLGDEDHRVRAAAATAFVDIISNLFYPEDDPFLDTTTTLTASTVLTGTRIRRWSSRRSLGRR